MTAPSADPVRDIPGAVARRDFARIGFVLLCAAAVWLRLWEPFLRVSVIGVAGVVMGGWPVFLEAIRNVRQRRMTMELSMTIALVAALLIGEFLSALLITVFVLAAEVLEGLTVGRGRRALRELVDLLPRQARVRGAAGVRVVPLADVRPGDLVLVNPGERVPVDGPVVAGHSWVDQATITGESMPVERAPGDGGRRRGNAGSRGAVQCRFLVEVRV